MSSRQHLPNRRGNVSFNFVHDGRQYHATATRYTNGSLAEIFLDVGKAGSAVQQHAEATAVLASIALQFGVPAETLAHAVQGGPLARAIELAMLPPEPPRGKRPSLDESIDRAIAKSVAKHNPVPA